MYQNFDSCHMCVQAYIHQIFVNVFAHAVCDETSNFFSGFPTTTNIQKITLNGEETAVCVTLMLMMMTIIYMNNIWLETLFSEGN